MVALMAVIRSGTHNSLHLNGSRYGDTSGSECLPDTAKVAKNVLRPER